MSSSISRDLTPESSASQLVLDETAPASAIEGSIRRSDVQALAASPGEAEPEPSGDPELTAGTELGNYVVEECIGRGAMASVYRAEHRVLNKRVALKVMAASLHASSEARQRFLREARAVAAIRHPNVVSISDAGLMGSAPYLVMELLEGLDLEQHLERHGPFSAEALAALALPIVAALAAAHDAGVIHRDLKPGNIFLSRAPDGQLVPKLLDFGISKFANASGPANLAMTAFDQLMGSPLYLPPEALQGSRELTVRSDQYSLGVVLYECITGQAPFFRDGLVPLLNAIVEGACPAPRSLRPEIPQALERAISRAMSVDPAQRFEDIRDLGRALLPLADLRSQHIWRSAFALSSAMIVLPSALVPASLPPARKVPAAAELRPAAAATRRVRPWRALSLLSIGTTLLALGIARVRAPAPAARVVRDAVLVAEDPGPRFSEAVAPSAAAAGAVALSGGTSASALERVEPWLAAAAGRKAAAVPVPHETEPGRAEPKAIQAPANRGRVARAAGRGSGAVDRDVDLNQLFFSGAASDGETNARPRRERASKASVRGPVLINEAPLFD